MEFYVLVKTIHIVSATVLFGTGLGIAFFFWMGMRAGFQQGDAKAALFASRTTVIADMLFTLNAGIVQPISGLALIYIAGHDPLSFWLIATYALYLIAFACWLPVVILQLRIRNSWAIKAEGGSVDDAVLARQFKWWFALGWPAFAALIGVFWLMVVKPV